MRVEVSSRIASAGMCFAISTALTLKCSSVLLPCASAKARGASDVGCGGAVVDDFVDVVGCAGAVHALS